MSANWPLVCPVCSGLHGDHRLSLRTSQAVPSSYSANQWPRLLLSCIADDLAQTLHISLLVPVHQIIRHQFMIRMKQPWRSHKASYSDPWLETFVLWLWGLSWSVPTTVLCLACCLGLSGKTSHPGMHSVQGKNFKQNLLFQLTYSVCLQLSFLLFQSCMQRQFSVQLSF